MFRREKKGEGEKRDEMRIGGAVNFATGYTGRRGVV